MDDIDIIKRVQNGDSESFSLLVEKYHRSLLNFIYRLVGDGKIVEDIGQEVFLSIYKSIRNFDVLRGTPFSAWLFITARNRCISELRKNRSMPHVAIEDSGDLVAKGKSPEEDAIEQERIEALRACLVQLDEPFRNTLLQSLRGDSLEEIAAKTGASVGTVKSRIHRAKDRILGFMNERIGGKDYERV